jgi:uncharacterized membrane protein
MIEKIQVAWQVWDWLSSPAGAAIFAALFGLSEALAAIPGVQSNSVFQAVSSLLKKLAKK